MEIQDCVAVLILAEFYYLFLSLIDKPIKRFKF